MNDDVKIVPPRPSEGLPEYMFTEFPGMEEKMADDIYAAVYWKLRDQAQKQDRKADFEKDIEKQLGLQALAMTEAGVQANRVQGAADRASAMLLQLIQKNGYYRMIKGEYTDIREFLADKYDGMEEGSPRLSDVVFLQEVVVPTIIKLGNGTVKDLLKMKDHWSKTTAAVPWLRDSARIMLEVEKAYNKTIEGIEMEIKDVDVRLEIFPEDEELKEQAKLLNSSYESEIKRRDEDLEQASKQFKAKFVKAIQVITNPSVPTWGPNGVGEMLKRGNQQVRFEGSKCQVGDREVAFLIYVPREYERAVEAMTRQLIEFGDTDGKLMVASLGQLVLKDGKGKQVNKKPKK